MVLKKIEVANFAILVGSLLKKLKAELYQLKYDYGNQLSLQELRYITDTDFGGLESKKK